VLPLRHRTSQPGARALDGGLRRGAGSGVVEGRGRRGYEYHSTGKCSPERLSLLGRDDLKSKRKESQPASDPNEMMNV
jgi:hypothetical protein